MLNTPDVRTQAPGAAKLDWGEIQKELDQSGSNWFLLSKNPNARVRLLNSPNDARPFLAVETTYEGRVREKYLMFVAEAAEGPVKVAVMPKTALRAIVNLATNGWDLFDSMAGIPVILSKYTSNGRTSYAVTPAGAKPMSMTPAVIEELNDLTLAQAAQDFREWQDFMATKRASGDAEDSGE